MQKKELNLHPVIIYVIICNLVSMAELSINILRLMPVLKKMIHHFKTGPTFFEKEGCTSAHLNPAPTVYVR